MRSAELHAASGSRLRLVLADDNAEVLRQTCDLLSPEFELVAIVENGSGLLAAAQQYKPDAIVTDISMPELNGLDASRRILALGCCTTIIILSVNNDPEIVRTACNLGVRGYVLKENAGEDLIVAIRSAVRGELFLSAAIRQSRD